MKSKSSQERHSACSSPERQRPETMDPQDAAKPAKCTPAQREAMRRYRERNEDDLRAKARERMARYRAREENDGYKEQARAAHRRYRERNASLIANNQQVRRAQKYINAHGIEAWAVAYDKRKAKAAGSLDNCSPPSPPLDAEPDSTSFWHNPELNNFLDNHDPTTAPDYVPKPGEERYFQRGKWRWY
ncbi:hypothetical protein B0H11DRAFT_2229822 [Mycena galericulata]|nr:hypothetical protein B0H11DRAFT_2229822 [Mycena galericulata]